MDMNFCPSCNANLDQVADGLVRGCFVCFDAGDESDEET